MENRMKQTPSVCLQERAGRRLTTIHVILAMAIIFALTFTSLGLAAGAKVPEVMHPVMNPKMYIENGQCSNCGMNLNMWARTRYSFENTSGEGHSCSINCLADIAYRAGEKPGNVQAAIYLEPEKMLPAETLFYVMGSSAKGTMTMNSKIGFASEEDATTFAAEYGGKVVGFADAFAQATAELEGNRKKIALNRSNSGKIKEPLATDSCHVCGMPPAKFPSHRTQILTKDQQTIHFCSTQCLVSYQDDPKKIDADKPVMPMTTWVTVYPDGGYDYAGGLYYLVGSSQTGSMGPEAIPLRSRADAEKMAAEKGGKVVTFDQLTSALIRGK